MSYEKVKQAKHIKVGLRQTIKAIKRGEASEVIIAEDADAHIIEQIETACLHHQVPVVYVDSMRQLGKTCGIEVGAACVAILN